MSMDKDEWALFERMTIAQEQIMRAQERLAGAAEKQQPGKAVQILTTVGAVVAAGGIFNIIDLIIKWFTGG
jgi:hypothetical protein